jgi:hypothetical protein
MRDIIAFLMEPSHLEPVLASSENKFGRLNFIVGKIVNNIFYLIFFSDNFRVDKEIHLKFDAFEWIF